MAEQHPLSLTAAEIFATPAAPAVTIPADAEHCSWGVIDPDARRVLSVPSGAVLRVEAITHHAGDAPDLMMDETTEALWRAIPEAERGPGVHILNGPIEIGGAAAGSTLAVQILAMTPRHRFGSNCAAHWGLLYGRFNKERITIYELDEAGSEQFPPTASPKFAYDFTGRPLYDQPGFVTEPSARREEPFSRRVAVPVRPHLGVLGVAPQAPGRRSSIPPGEFGGNVDNWRFGPGSTVYFPIFREGAGLYFGDPHYAQGDGEICGTAIEASSDVLVRVAIVGDVRVTAPVIETEAQWIAHGFGDTLDVAMRTAAEAMLQLLVDRAGLRADDAYSLMSVAVDFSITQVVDGTVGCHAAVRTDIFR